MSESIKRRIDSYQSFGCYDWGSYGSNIDLTDSLSKKHIYHHRINPSGNIDFKLPSSDLIGQKLLIDNYRTLTNSGSGSSTDYVVTVKTGGGTELCYLYCGQKIELQWNGSNWVQTKRPFNIILVPRIATLSGQGGTTTAPYSRTELGNGNVIEYLRYDDNTLSTMTFQFILPRGWEAITEDLYFTIYWATLSTSANNVEWKLYFNYYSDGDTLDDNRLTASDGDIISAATGTAYDIIVTPRRLLIAPGNTSSKNSLQSLVVARDARLSNGNDTLASSAMLLGVELEGNLSIWY